jgi:hypothetical protein
MVSAAIPKKTQGCSRRFPWVANRRRYIEGALPMWGYLASAVAAAAL